MNHRFSALLTFLAVLILVVAVLPARADDYSHVRVVRLSFVEGNVQYQRADEGWQPAVMNLPIQQGFSLQTGNGFAEVEFEDGLAIRLANNSSVEFTELALMDGRRVTRLTLPRGTALITANLSHGDELSVAASNLKLNVPRSGRFRVDVSPTESWVTLFKGNVDVASASGATPLSGHQTLHEDAANVSAPEIIRSPAPDAFDKWVSAREEVLQNAQNGANDYLTNRNYIPGFAELYGYGNWMNIRGYGLGWQPFGVGMGWMPYSTGAWSYMSLTGWNWISAEPWGWMPYHFGGWIDDPDYGWIWIPGNLGAWQPANASWVQVNNQVGWIPNAPPTSATGKQMKVQPPTRTPVVIFARQGSNGLIMPGGRAPLAQGTAIQSISVSPPAASAFVSTNRGSAQGTAGANTPAQSVPASQAHAPGAPGFSAAGPHASGPNSAPPPMQAPRSMPAAPALMRGPAFNSSRGYGGPSGASSGGATSAATMRGNAGASAPPPASTASSSAGKSSGGGSSTPAPAASTSSGGHH